MAVVHVTSLAGESVFGPEELDASATVSALIGSISNRCSANDSKELLHMKLIHGARVLCPDELLVNIASEGTPLELSCTAARPLPDGTFSSQQTIGFHIARQWILIINADGNAEWSHETYTDSPGDDYDDNFMKFSGRAEWCDDDDLALQISMEIDGSMQKFKVQIEDSGDLVKVDESSCPSKNTHHSGKRTLKLKKNGATPFCGSH